VRDGSRDDLSNNRTLLRQLVRPGGELDQSGKTSLGTLHPEEGNRRGKGKGSKGPLNSTPSQILLHGSARGGNPSRRLSLRASEKQTRKREESTRSEKKKTHVLTTENEKAK